MSSWTSLNCRLSPLFRRLQGNPQIIEATLRRLQCLLGFGHFEGKVLDVLFRGSNISIDALDTLDLLPRYTKLLRCSRKDGGFRRKLFQSLHALHRRSHCFLTLASSRSQLPQLLLDAFRVLDELLKPFLLVSRFPHPVSGLLKHASLGSLLDSLRGVGLIPARLCL